MKNTQNKSGFTLVELIIVITILAVLATIAFVSFQGYAADSRDAKVTAEIGQLRQGVEARSAEGVSLLSFVNGTGSSLTSGNLAGTGVSADSTDYKAGTVNFAVLGADADKFGSYRVGATQRVGGAYELAGKLEKTNTAFVTGNFNSRETLSLTGTVSDSTNRKITLADADVGRFKVGDVLSTPAGKITSISTDLKVITLDAGTVAANNADQVLTLSWTEISGLIGTVNALTTSVTNGGSNLPY